MLPKFENHRACAHRPEPVEVEDELSADDRRLLTSLTAQLTHRALPEPDSRGGAIIEQAILALVDEYGGAGGCRHRSWDGGDNTRCRGCGSWR